MISIKAAFLLSLFVAAGLETVDARRLDREKLKKITQGLGSDKVGSDDKTQQAEAEEAAVDSKDEEATKDAQVPTALLEDEAVHKVVAKPINLTVNGRPVVLDPADERRLLEGLQAGLMMTLEATFGLVKASVSLGSQGAAVVLPTDDHLLRIHSLPVKAVLGLLEGLKQMIKMTLKATFWLASLGSQGV